MGFVENLNHNKQRKNSHESCDVVEDDFDLNLLYLKPEYSSFEGFTEFSFHDGENGFDFIPLMVLISIEPEFHTPTVIPGDLFSFPVPDGDKCISIQ